MDATPPLRPPPSLDRCATCGQPSSAPERCPHCGGSLLVDVLLDPPVAGPREAYAAARAAAAAPGLEFAAVRVALLERPGAPVAAGLRRDRARALVAALEEAGLAAVVRAAAPSGPARRTTAGAALVAVAAVAVAAVAAAGASSLLRARSSPAVGPGPTPAAAPVAPQPQVVEPPAAAPSPAAGDAPRDLSTEELARAARPALVVLTCPGRLGSGFFVGSDRVLTNAHVACADGVPMEARLADGRRLVARVTSRDEWLDYAVVEVPGAGVTAPLPLGDSTALVAGSPVVLVGSPLGLSETVHAGKVSFVARNLEGVAHVQVNADVNPGNSGGPLLDGRGRAVAIVTLKATGASGVGFALPIEYARDALDARQPDPAAAERWREILARVAAEDEAEATRLVARLDRPLLVSAGAAGDRLVVAFMKRWTGSPAPVPVTVEVRDGARVVCELSGTVATWEDVEERFKAAKEQDRATRTIRWMLRRGLAAGTSAGAVALDVSACPEETSAHALVALKGSTAPDEIAVYPSSELAAARRELQAGGRLAARRDQAGADGESEWRGAFRSLRDRVAKLEEDRRLLRDALERRHDSALIERARRELPAIEAELRRRQEQLDELERRASAAAIPREWRQ